MGIRVNRGTRSVSKSPRSFQQSFMTIEDGGFNRLLLQGNGERLKSMESNKHISNSLVLLIGLYGLQVQT